VAVALRLGIGMVLAAACAVAIWMLPARSTYGQPRGIRLSLQRGALKVTAPAVAATASGTKSVTVTVTDARGSGAGWSLRLLAAQPVSVMRVTTRCAAHSTCALPRASGLGPSPLVLHSLTGSGMGVIKLTVTLARLSSGPAVPVKFAVS
jgi:hypothetical protein